MNNKIAIIGGGNLGTAIAEGLISSRFAKPQHIIITKRNIATLSFARRKRRDDQQQ
jgi:pyrroline-5-carboxylate reductase